MAAIPADLYAEYIKQRAIVSENKKILDEMVGDIKALAGDDEELTVNGKKVLAFGYVDKFAEAKFLKENPDLAEQFTVERTEKRVDTKFLRRLLPDVYRKYQVRQLTVPE